LLPLLQSQGGDTGSHDQKTAIHKLWTILLMVMSYHKVLQDCSNYHFIKVHTSEQRI
jgi:hypothetical protein